ncbi:probable ATP-dependent RNA helicase DDX58 isoform X2 [Pecten maximus]|uniref:probable ATP-dependent RNA helicase DDX58 isoform X2 n=1 Tax=Pecten maximus TaxID=6579 RepID=UPI0014589B56|nr:probable ATP-dependent RNA helicase DDX58 isoform X2 [Pecten maximus]
MEGQSNDDLHLGEMLDVYRPVLVDSVIATELLPSLTDVVSGSDAEKVRNVTRQNSNRAGTEYLLEVLVERKEVPGRWRMLVNALKKHGYESLSMILEGEMEMEDRDRNKRIINIFMVELRQGINPLEILPSLIQKGVLGQEDKENITAENRNNGALAASAVLLDRIQRKKSDWYSLFLQTLAENRFGHLAEKIDPDFMKKWKIRNEEEERRERLELHTMENYDSDFGEALSDIKQMNRTPNVHQDFNTEVKTTEKLVENLKLEKTGDSNDEETVTEVKQTQTASRQPTEHDELSEPLPPSSPSLSPTPVTIHSHQSASVTSTPSETTLVYQRVERGGPDLSLFRYQEELAQPGIDGHNSIVVAPTNSGKTHVAIKIMQHHLRKCHSKMIFLVPTSALATQQRDRCYELLKCQAKVMTGESQARDKYVDMSIHLKNHDIIVATPQILVNCLLSEDVSMSDFSLIVFDECHRTYEDTPYNNVMRLYLDLKLTEENASLPQILGMTASLGSGNAKCQSGADDWVKHLMNNMDTQKLVTVKENIEELQAKINNTDTGELRRPPAVRDGERYTEWCSTLKKQITSTPDNDLHRSLKIYTDYLEVYHRALIIYRDARSSDALQYLKEEMDEMFFEETAVETDHKMHKLFEDNQPLMESENSQDNPKLHQVQVRLSAVFRNEPDSRAIIYVKTIDLARFLEVWMNECPELQPLNAVRFVGAHARVGIGGITKVVQDTILKAFRDGTHKVVIGTSVLEEGLDIPRCNLVILYDHVTNEIQRVQTRGRIRRDNSHFVLIASETGQAAKKEQVNEIREEMGSAAIERVQNEIDRDPRGFLQRQQAEQLKEKQKRDAAEKIEREMLLNSPVYQVKCNHCRSLLCLSSDLRKIKVHHTIVAGGMKDTLMSGPRGKPSYQDKDMEHGVAELYCKDCKTHIGSINKSMSLYFPMPRIDQIVFSRENNIKACKKWKNVQSLFGIKQFCPIEDMRLIMSLPTEDKDFYTK